MLLVQNVTPYAGAINPSFWSLGLEWQWYWLFPLLLFAMVRMRGLVLVPLFAVGVAWALALDGTILADQALPARLFEFAVGVGCAQLVVARRTPPWPLLAVAAVVPLVLLDAFPNVVGAAATVTGLRQPLHGLAFGSLLLLALQTRPVGAAMRVRPLAGLGTISYSVYLTHQPLLQLGMRVTSASLVSLALAISAGWLFYQLVERPCLMPATRERWLPRLTKLFGWTDQLCRPQVASVRLRLLPLGSGARTGAPPPREVCDYR